MISWWIYVIGSVAAVLLSVVFTPFMKKFAFWAGAVSVPNQRSVHTKPMPLLGGLAIFLAFVGAYFVIRPAVDLGDNGQVAVGILAGGAIIALVGALDDRFNLSPKLKLLGQILAALAVIYISHNELLIDIINIPFADPLKINSNWISIPLTVVWIVGVTNAINLIDGLDGLSAGVSAIAAGTIGVLALLMGNVTVALLCFILVGSVLGFLFYNFHPAKIFMGDSGSLFLGFVLSTLSIFGYKQAVLVSLVVPVMILGVPLTDTFIAIVRRKLNNRPIFKADKEHLHHCLMNMGFSMRKTVLIIYGISLVFGTCAVVLSQTQTWIAVVVSVILLLLLEVGAEAIGIISKTRKPVIQFCQRVFLALVSK